MTNPHVGRRRTAALLTFAFAAVFLLVATPGADAAIVPTVPLATSGEYAVLGGATVTNTGPSILDGSLGVWPGPEVTGFPPGTVLPPGTTHTNDAVAQQAQSDLTVAYDDAALRPLNATTTADLGGLELQGGVYAGPSKGALGLTGTLTLDGAGNPNSVFVFQTNSSLITEVGSRVQLINGAQECNVFWQVGSSATLGTGSVFVGNILALTSISVNSGVLVHGRALARNGEVTLINDTFSSPTCDLSGPVPTTAAPTTAPATTVPGPTTVPVPTTAPVPTTTPAVTPTTDGQEGGITTTTANPGFGFPNPPEDTTPGGDDGTPPGSPSLPRTGADSGTYVLVAMILLALGAVFVRSGRSVAGSR
jgi:LPXTG-motif cell wall-anchored protein